MPRRARWPWLVLAVSVLLAATLIATRPRPEPVPVSERAWRVAVQTVRPRTLAPERVLYGRVESRWSGQLSAAVASEVLAVRVDEGDAVTRGQVLVELDPADSRLRVRQREAEAAEAEARIEQERQRVRSDREMLERERRLLALLRKEARRLDDLVRRQAGARSARDAARQAVERQAVVVAQREQAIADHPARLRQLEAALERARSALEQARLELARCTVRAPFAGRVASIEVAPGRRVRVGDPLLSLYDTGAMRVRALVPEQDLPVLREALSAGRALIAEAGIDGRTLRARLSGLAGAVDRGSGGVMALFDLEATRDPPREGRFVRLRLALPPQAGVIALPPEALYGVDRIYVVDEDSRMRPLRVRRVGMRGEGAQARVLVRAPALEAGARVVVTHLPNAVDGLLVRVVEAS